MLTVFAKRAAAHSESGTAAASGMGRPAMAREVDYASNLARAKEFAKSNPQITAEIVKEWMAKE